MSTTTAAVCQRFSVEGMTCRHCELVVSAEVARLPGVTRVVVDALAGTVMTESDEPLDRSAVAVAVNEAGYQLIRSGR